MTLLNLPAEIRNMIWVKVVDDLRRPYKHVNPIDDDLTALQVLRRTCRQVDREVSSFFFSTSIFVVLRPQAWRGRLWLQRIGPRNRMLIRIIKLDAENARWDFERDPFDAAFIEAESWAFFLQNVPNLDHLKFAFSECGFSYWGDIFSVQDVVELPSASSLVTALTRMSHLKSLGLASIDIGMLHAILTLPCLTILHIGHLHRHASSDHKQLGGECPRLESLRVGVAPQGSWISKVPPFAQSRQSSRAFYIEALATTHLLYPVNIGGFTLRLSRLHDLHEDVSSITIVDRDAFRDLVGRCTRLRLLGLGLDVNGSDHLDHLPPSLEKIALICHGDFSQEVLIDKLRCLQQRCISLTSVTIFISWWKPRRDWSSMDLGSRYDTLFDHLQILSLEGIEIHCVIRMRQLRPDGHWMFNHYQLREL